jgi:radical SAM superfamily enzyme YgiQ (UPF0313 family)
LAELLLITPPFTQLNTPYPATPYLKGFLNTKKISCFQCDLGIEVILDLFSKSGLNHLFSEVLKYKGQVSENALRITALRNTYINTVDQVVRFLQGKNPTLAHLICQENFLPEASRFDQLQELDWAFGTMGIQDKAKHLATLYLEDLSDLIVETVDPHFGFSRYAERLGRSANSFDDLYGSLQSIPTFIDAIHFRLLADKMDKIKPRLVGLSVPFPGNLYAAFRTAQWIKKHYPDTKISMGGGFPNTELRSLSDARVFEFFDFITLDDGEAPIENLLEHLDGSRKITDMKRTFALIEGKVVYIDHSEKPDYKQYEVGTPDYSDLLLDKYISVIEIVNPMHRMWSDGRWNKLTMAHGCYWAKCTFCDISLNYIKSYEPLAAKLLCDRMEQLIMQTGQNGFHFVDEAAPPALMRDLAIEILKRNLLVSWWTNIRFEKSFSRDLCLLLKASGCIAVSGGLEVASDRLLALIQKGVTVPQVAAVTRNFTEAGIMVHAYLMYGFPTQTVQETIDALEMVRQLFEAGVLQSGFWHQFAMTAHSPIGLYPDQFSVAKATDVIGAFANNDIVHTDPTGINHDQFSYGLKKSLYNFMHGLCLDAPLKEWFDFKIPATTIAPGFIEYALQQSDPKTMRPNSSIFYLGVPPELKLVLKTKKGKTKETAQLKFYAKQETVVVQFSPVQGKWLHEGRFDVFWNNPSMSDLKVLQLLLII